MNISAKSIWADVVKIRETAPLVHNITNYVVMNSSANALLAIGASPVMAHAEEEAADMARLAAALVLNIGTLSPHWIRAMHKAALKAHASKIPIVLDPVGAGATPYRTETARELISAVAPTVIRGNASEINAILVADAVTKGVDSMASSDAAVDSARKLNVAHGSVICISGATDYVIDRGQVIKVYNGHPLMTRVTGMGCNATALIGAFAAVNPSALAATVHAMAVMGIAGEIAREKSSGPGTLFVNFLDTLHNLTEEDIAYRLKLGQ